MECNKEEAIRAKGIAEKKMQNKDFVVAHRIALRAQQIFPDLENIIQMLAVCDVHCAAEHKMLGNEMDWYGILQVEPTADEALIKKQYRRFALLLHPDKNKFAGAEAAFKLIGEAQRVLLDRGKRSLHDMKRRSSLTPAAPNRPPQQASRNSYVGKQPGRVQNNFMSNPTSPYMGMNPQHQQPQQQTQPGLSNDRQSFWTACPFCGMKYHFYIVNFKKTVICRACSKSFIAFDTNAQGAPQGTNSNQPAFCQQKEVPSQGASKMGPQSTFENPSSNVKFQGNFGRENLKTGSFSKVECANEIGRGSQTYSNCGNVDMRVDKDGGSGEFKTFRKVNGKRARKQPEDSGESCDAGSSTDTDEDIVVEEGGNLHAGQNFGFYGEEYPRRSTRHKQQVSYKDNLSDDEIPKKKAKGSGSSCATEEETEDALLKGEASKMNNQAGLAADVKEDEKEIKQKEGSSSDGSSLKGNKETKKVNGKQKVKEDDYEKASEANNHSASSSSSKMTPDPEFYDCPDPDFSNFDKDREEECFKVGQMWAVYDTLDAMPRFYARIKKVFSTGFKLRITWLEPDPDDEDEIKWINEDLPVSCGKFKHGNSENTEDRLMFSHLVFWEKGSSRDTYMIYPRRGETWALFKNWGIKWNSDPDSYRKYEFEFVEVLSDYAEGDGICVAYLGKVKGFASLFSRIVKDGRDSFQIPQCELYRFSHRVPSFKMTGEERTDVPKGSFELDPASLPTNLEAVIAPEGLKMEAEDAHPNGSCSKSPTDEVKPMMESSGSACAYQADEKETHFDPGDSDNVIEDRSAPLTSTPEANEVPEPEFYDFDAEKSADKFQVGQIWALYSDEDGLPKYYGQIKKIASRPDFKLHLTWLIPSSRPDNIDKKVPICCGRFKISKGKSKAYTTTASFSHKLRAEPAGKNEYSILPRKGEVWALYKNWTTEIKCSDLEDCEYDIVEVLDENDSQIEVTVLERIDGFNSVFKAQVKGRSAVKISIPQVELLRFSHQLPAFRLTEEKGGILRGFWEVDPAAVPVLIFCSD